jgi:hypothetical protein
MSFKNAACAALMRLPKPPLGLGAKTTGVLGSLAVLGIAVAYPNSQAAVWSANFAGIVGGTVATRYLVELIGCEQPARPQADPQQSPDGHVPSFDR